MASTIGEGAYGNPTHIPIPNSQFSGSTSGIGGQSTESVKKYDSTYGFMRRYTPGSKRFTKLGGYNYFGPTGNWGHRVLQKINLVKQVSGIAGYLSADPLARVKHTKFIAMNYGRQRVDPLLPRGGSVPRVIDTSNVEDPKSFYSDYNWGNAPQPFHVQPIHNPHHTIPPNDDQEGLPTDPGPAKDDTLQSIEQRMKQHAQEQAHQRSLNPMAGGGGVGFSNTQSSSYSAHLDLLTGKTDGVEDLMASLNHHIPSGLNDFTTRRAAGITNIFAYPAVRMMAEGQVTQTTGNMDLEVGDVQSGKGGIGGIETGDSQLKSESKDIEMKSRRSGYYGLSDSDEDEIPRPEKRRGSVKQSDKSKKARTFNPKRKSSITPQNPKVKQVKPVTKRKNSVSAHLLRREKKAKRS
jgi:hypothetical protein